MGYATDLGTSTVDRIDPVTGYPIDRYGHLLDTRDLHDGRPIADWDKPGTNLPNFTSPYGHLMFAVGTVDDFFCFDWSVIDAGPRGKFIILHSVINSETGGFIQDGTYRVLPFNSMDEQRAAVRSAFFMSDGAVEWLYESGDKPLRHDRRRWNQEPEYFAISIARHCVPYKFRRKNGEDFPERSIRMAHRIAMRAAMEFAHDIED